MAQAFPPRYKLAIVLILLAVSIAFWNSIALYPIKLFVVLLHEVSHGLAAVLTGGAIQRIEINERIGGACYTTGGWPFVVVSAGYLGSMILGGMLFMLAQRSALARWLAAAIGGMCLLAAVLYVRNLFGFVFGIGFGAAFLACARWLPRDLLELLLQYIGATSCLYALVDVKDDLLTFQHRLTDAAIMADMTHIPAIVWGIAWSLLACAVFAIIVYATYKTHVSPAGPAVSDR
jgi:hypothetical protein